MTKQHEIDAQIEQAMQAKARANIKGQAVIFKLWTSKRKFSLGFNFRKNCEIGKKYENEDGSVIEVIAFA